MTDTDTDRLIEELHTKIVRVEFTKIDGTPRTMFCTLAPALLPPLPDLLHEDVRPGHRDICTVWDVEKLGWRSFRFDSITSLSIDTDAPV